MRAEADAWTWTLGERGPPESVEVTGKGWSTEEESHKCYPSGLSVAEALTGRLDLRWSSYIELETVWSLCGQYFCGHWKNQLQERVESKQSMALGGADGDLTARGMRGLFATDRMVPVDE